MMEKKGLGTRATRAEILHRLYLRKYVSGKSIEVSRLGEVVTKVLKDNAPRILSDEMTRKFEKEMEDVAAGKRKREDVVKEAEEVLTEVLADFKKNEKKIGKKLLKGLTESRAAERDMGPCPKCDNNLRVIVSRKSGKRFVGCGGYPKCVTGFPLPQRGYITKLGTVCKECGLPMIQVTRKGARPYRMCINHKCKTKENWGKKGKKGKKDKKDEKKEAKAEKKPAKKVAKKKVAKKTKATKKKTAKKAKKK
jgi:DNA topoisomerase-1